MLCLCPREKSSNVHTRTAFTYAFVCVNIQVYVQVIKCVSIYVHVCFAFVCVFLFFIFWSHIFSCHNFSSSAASLAMLWSFPLLFSWSTRSCPSIPPLTLLTAPCPLYPCKPSPLCCDLCLLRCTASSRNDCCSCRRRWMTPTLTKLSLALAPWRKCCKFRLFCFARQRCA